MSGPSVICTKCGFANVPGDQFCGSCGAFLEWAGSVVAADTVAGKPTAPAAPEALATLATPSPAPSAPTAPVAPPVTPATPVPTATPPAPPDEALLRCPACGVANAATRTFCQSCGAKLAPAARVAPKSREEIAAAVAAVPTKTPAAGPSRSAPTAAAKGAAKPASSSGGLPGWLIAVVLAGILVGVGAVVLPNLLRGQGPSSAASEAPSVAGPSAVPSPPAPSSSSTGVLVPAGAARALYPTPAAGIPFADAPIRGSSVPGAPAT